MPRSNALEVTELGGDLLENYSREVVYLGQLEPFCLFMVMEDRPLSVCEEVFDWTPRRQDWD